MSDTRTSTWAPASSLQLTRVIGAPRALVFSAWAQEEQLVQWYGPRAYPVVSWTHEFVPGGRFSYVMRAPDGSDAPGGGEYVDIVLGERIVGLSRITVEGRVIFEVEQNVTFADSAGGGTQLTVDSHIVRNDDFPGAAGMEQGWNETLDRLAKHVLGAAPDAPSGAEG